MGESEVMNGALTIDVMLDVLVLPEAGTRHVDEESIAGLAESIKTQGVLQPIVVRGIDRGTGTQYEVLAGRRRVVAARMAGLSAIPARVGVFTDEEAETIRIVENLQREDPSPLEECDAFWRLVELRGGLPALDAVAQHVGKSPRYVAQRLRLRSLAAPARAGLERGTVSLGAALLIASYPEAVQRAALGGEHPASDKAWDTTGVILSQLERWLKDYAHVSLAKAPWDLDDANLVPAAGSCTLCPKRTGNVAVLFPGPGNVCTDPACFREKLRAAAARDGMVFLAASQYYDPRDGAGMAGLKPLQRYEWRKATRNCADPVPGFVVVEAPGWDRKGPKFGDRVKVCIDAKCQAHGGEAGLTPSGVVTEASARAGAKEAMRARKAVRDARDETLRRTEVLRRIANAHEIVPGVTTQIIESLVGDGGWYGNVTMPNDRCRMVCAVYNWVPVRKKGEHVDWVSEVRKHLPELKAGLRALPFLAVLTLAVDAKATANFPRDPKRLYEVAKMFGVDAKTVKAPEPEAPKKARPIRTPTGRSR